MDGRRGGGAYFRGAERRKGSRQRMERQGKGIRPRVKVRRINTARTGSAQNIYFKSFKHP